MSPIEGTFNLVDHDGNPVTEQTYRGSWMMVFFGFTHCEVVCPRALSRLSSVLAEIGHERAQCIRPLYITVDPDRDTPPVMKQFVESRYPRFTGLTGTTEQIENAKNAFNVFARPKADAAAPDGYVVPHTAITYLLDPTGTYRTHWTDTRDVVEIVPMLTAEIDGLNRARDVLGGPRPHSSAQYEACGDTCGTPSSP
ncbi:SCO family protein [Mycobacterium heidelbergense]|uniref:SCO family protein n=1 Tax=Mycobacterium heidelbergense TaxID=53376 RepID=UPI003CF54CEC